MIWPPCFMVCQLVRFPALVHRHCPGVISLFTRYSLFSSGPEGSAFGTGAAGAAAVAVTVTVAGGAVTVAVEFPPEAGAVTVTVDAGVEPAAAVGVDEPFPALPATRPIRKATMPTATGRSHLRFEPG